MCIEIIKDKNKKGRLKLIKSLVKKSIREEKREKGNNEK